ncbi:MAG: hypothetical protein VW450_05895 [Chloroflexota bacterium]
MRTLVAAVGVLLLAGLTACGAPAAPMPLPVPTPTHAPVPTPTRVDEGESPGSSLSESDTYLEVPSGFVGGEGWAEGYFNFTGDATFHNPATDEWDYGFYFHEDGGDYDAVLIRFTSEQASWEHAANLDGSWYTIESGHLDVALLDTRDYGSNWVRITVKEQVGSVWVNGKFIAEFLTDATPRGSGLGVIACTYTGSCPRPALVHVTKLFFTR